MPYGQLTIRQWQEKFLSGDFRHSDTRAGWDDFYAPLNNRKLQTLACFVMGITDPFILDNYYIYFKYNTPAKGPMYPDVRFMPLDEDSEKYFLVSLDSPHERKKWAIVTERFGYGSPEFECENVREMIKYVNHLGPELEHKAKPPFVAERRAVEIYAFIHGEPMGTHAFREGEHRYSYTSYHSRQQRMVMASVSLDDFPPGVDPKQIEEVTGIYIWCPENGDKQD